MEEALPRFGLKPRLPSDLRDRSSVEAMRFLDIDEPGLP